MSVFFNAQEVFEMAIQIECAGKEFYREASRQAQDKQTGRELADLAAMEEKHEAVFTEMQRKAAADTCTAPTYDPEGEVGLYLNAFAEGQVFDLTRPAPPDLLGAGADLKRVFQWALDREGDSVLFYTGLRELMPAGPDRTRVEAIIGEEMGHIAMLSRRFYELASKD